MNAEDERSNPYAELKAANTMSPEEARKSEADNERARQRLRELRPDLRDDTADTNHDKWLDIDWKGVTSKLKVNPRARDRDHEGTTEPAVDE